MKKIVLKAILLFAPFFLVIVAEVFILPIDFFAFRAWEAVMPYNSSKFPGVFYPNQTLISWTAGDLNPRGPKTRLIDFYTDKYGFRNRPTEKEPLRYDIVTVGDSLIAGSHLKQNETVAEILQSICKCDVYNYSAGGSQQLLQIMADPRFMESPEKRPRFVVYESRYYDFYNSIARHPIVNDVQLNRTVKNPSYWEFAWDRFEKHMFLHSLQARLRLTKVAAGAPLEYPPIDKAIENSRKAMHSYAKFFGERGIQFVLFVMPSDDRKLDRFLTELDETGVPTVSYLPKPGLPHGYEMKDYYFSDDTHWRPESAAAAAEKIWQKIQILDSKSQRLSRN